MDTELYNFYNVPQIGAGAIPYYSGVQSYQVGGSFLGGLLKMAIPILKNVGRSALGIAAQTANDVINKNSNIRDSLVKNVKRRFDSTINNDESTEDDPETIYNKRRQRHVRMRKKRTFVV